MRTLRPAERASCSPIPQLANPGEVRDEDLLPSFLYLPGAERFPGRLARAALGRAAASYVVGRLAQKRGVENAGRLVSSAKSWLSHSGVDRTAPLLPFRAPEGVAKISPVEASRRYLEHLREAWDAKMPDAPFARAAGAGDRAGVLRRGGARTDPARPPKQAGYQNVTLLEEPQAAFYAWIERHPDWRERVQVGDLILVVDIGGGTTDFTLIAVTEQRRGTGARTASPWASTSCWAATTSTSRWPAWWRTAWRRRARASTAASIRRCGATAGRPRKSCSSRDRKAKEQPVTILGKGTGLVGGTIKATLQRADIERVLADGFLPAGGQHRHAARAAPRRPAGTRAALRRRRRHHAPPGALPAPAGGQRGARRVRRGPSGLACPTHVLFNGGVLNAGLVRERMLAALNAWLARKALPPVKPLSGEDLMHAVSRGAAYYGLARPGRGVRIRGGVPRTYYVGIESAMPSVPGFPAPLKALTVVPFGMEEGTDVRIPGPRVRPGGGRAGRVPLLHLRLAQERPAGRPDRGLSATSLRNCRPWK